MVRSRFQVIKRKPPEARTSSDGQLFDSMGEMKRYEYLKTRLDVRDLKRQVRIPLIVRENMIGDRDVAVKSRTGRDRFYTVDFTYEELQNSTHGSRDWVLVYEEYKGVDDPTSELRRSVVERDWGIKIRITGPAHLPKAKRAVKKTETKSGPLL